jgi:hypothetical protein
VTPKQRKEPAWDLEFKRAYNDLKQAAGLLRDSNLVWSADLEAIKEPLANFLDKNASMGRFNDKDIIRLARAIIAEENDLTI